MHHLLIVDDEILAAQGIKKGIEWGRLGFSTVSVAHSVAQAKKIIGKRRVDVMICDIEMPKGNGIELLQWVKEHDPTVEAVFLTCHADFQYAKQAVQLGSLDYLLKPVRFEELEASIRKAVHKIEAELQKLKMSESMRKYQTLWSKSHSVLVERFWIELLGRNIPGDPEKIQEIIDRRSLSVRADMMYVPVLISMQEWGKAYTVRELKLMEFALRNAAEYSMRLERMQGQIVPVLNGKWLALIPQEPSSVPDRENLRTNCEQFVSFSSRYFSCQLSCYIGHPQEIADIPESADRLLDMDAENVTLTNRVLQLGEGMERKAAAAAPQINEWLELMKQLSSEALLSAIDRFCRRLKQDGCTSHALKALLHDFLQMAYHVLQLKGLQARLLFSDSESTERMSAEVRTVDQLRERARYIAIRTIQAIEAVEESQTVVEKAKQYISENIDKNLSREHVAGHVSLSPDHLTRVFKKKTGQSISEYLMEERIRYAKHLLTFTDSSVSEVASSVGYINFSHFSKTFRRLTHMNPQEFRKKHRMAGAPSDENRSSGTGTLQDL